MKKLFYSALVCLCSSITFTLHAAESDVSNATTYYEVFRELDNSIVTHLDLRIAKANSLLGSNKSGYEFPGLEYVCGGKYEVILNGHGQYSKIICEIEVEGYFCSYSDGSGSIEHQYNLARTQKIYTTVRDIAKKYINNFIDDENIVVMMNLSFREFNKDEKLEITIIPIAKWENGQAIFYEGFIKHLYKNS